MLKLLALLMLIPTASFAKDSCSQASCEKVFHIRENHPKMQGLEVELEDGQVISLAEFLENISENQKGDEVTIFGGEVPWPITDPDEEEKKKKEEEK